MHSDPERLLPTLSHHITKDCLKKKDQNAIDRGEGNLAARRRKATEHHKHEIIPFVIKTE